MKMFERVAIALDYVYLYLCSLAVRAAIAYVHLPGGDILRRLTLLSGAADTNANVCLFLRYLYTFAPGKFQYDVQERKWASIFLERQYFLFARLIRMFGLRLLPPLIRPLYMSYHGRAMEASKFVDECINTRKITQVVILGAGFDTTAYRIREQRIAKGRYITVFEVDRKSVQDRKIAIMRQSLSDIEWKYYTEGVVFVACNFGVDSIANCLLESGFNPKEPVALLWEGVTYYLTPTALSATLSDLKTLFGSYRNEDESGFSSPASTSTMVSPHQRMGSNSYLFMDYMHVTKTLDSGPWDWKLNKALAHALGTGFISGFNDVEKELRQYNMQVTRHLSQEEILKPFLSSTNPYFAVMREKNSTYGHHEPDLALVECSFVKKFEKV